MLQGYEADDSSHEQFIFDPFNSVRLNKKHLLLTWLLLKVDELTEVSVVSQLGPRTVAAVAFYGSHKWRKSPATPTASVPSSKTLTRRTCVWDLNKNKRCVWYSQRGVKMTVCNFYLQGRCRYGDKCWNEHPRGGNRGGGGGQQHSNNYNRASGQQQQPRGGEGGKDDKELTET